MADTREQRLEEALRDMVGQFAYTGQGKRGRAVMHTGGLSALEHAFSVLDMDDPTYTPWAECEVKGCYKHTSAGVPTELDAYRSVCGDHYQIIDKQRLKYKTNKCDPVDVFDKSRKCKWCKRRMKDYPAPNDKCPVRR